MNPYPTIRDTGALNLSPGNFLGDTVSSPLGIALAVGMTYGGSVIAGKKHKLVGAALGLALTYALWARGSKIVGA